MSFDTIQDTIVYGITQLWLSTFSEGVHYCCRPVQCGRELDIFKFLGIFWIFEKKFCIFFFLKFFGNFSEGFFWRIFWHKFFGVSMVLQCSVTTNA